MIEGPEEHKAVTCAEAGRKGGTKTRDRYGRAHYQAAGRKGGAETRARHDAEHYQRIAAMGGRAKHAKAQARQAEPAVPEEER